MLSPECYYAAGDPPSDVMLVQTSLTEVTVSWTAPSATPAPTGYQVNVTHIESSLSQTGKYKRDYFPLPTPQQPVWCV